MKKRIADVVTVAAMVLALTVGMGVNVNAEYVPDYSQVYPESGYYYLTNYQTGEYMYYDPEATWKYIKCGDEEDADIWYIHGGANTGYEIALARDTSFIAKLDDGLLFPDFNHTYLLRYDTPVFAYDYVRLERHSSDYGDHLYNGEVWYGIKTTYKKAIRSVKPKTNMVMRQSSRE